MTHLEKFIEVYSNNLLRLSYSDDLASFIDNNSYNEDSESFDNEYDWDTYNTFAGKIVDPFYSEDSEDYIGIDQSDKEVESAMEILGTSNLFDGLNKLGISPSGNVVKLINLINVLGY